MQNTRLLIVDDEPNSLMALAAYLASENFECRIANNGMTAIAVALEWVPDGIIMDVSMPGLSGVEAALILRHQARTSEIPIVAHTALSEPDVNRRMVDHEFDGYCQKGHTTVRLVGIIKSVVKGPSRSRQE